MDECDQKDKCDIDALSDVGFFDVGGGVDIKGDDEADENGFAQILVLVIVAPSLNIAFDLLYCIGRRLGLFLVLFSAIDLK